MHIVLLSGGSGVRLWPLSSEARPKQFLKLLGCEDGTKHSMIQRTLKMLRQFYITSRIVVATGKQHTEVLSSQIDEDDMVDLVVEPESRDTFPAVSLAVSYLQSKANVCDNETIVVMPVDQYAEADYYRTLQKLDYIIQNNVAELAMIGIQPNNPSDQYGYIVPTGNTSNGYSLVRRFTEKPSASLAETLISEGALWNSGIFAFKAGFLSRIVREQLLTAEFDDVLLKFGKLPKISFDYAVAEVAHSRAMIPYSGVWKDLGTWDTIGEEMSSNCIGEAYQHQCTNTLIINELSVPIHAIDTCDQVIVASRDGVLVTSKMGSRRLKEYLGKLPKTTNQRDTSWGSYSVIDKLLTERACHITQRVLIKSGATTNVLQSEADQCSLLIVEGNGILDLNGTDTALAPGSIAKIEPNDYYRIQANSQIIAIEAITRWLI
ncbi:MAG: sugar phosphate nucleotidyltransferase [Christensenellales bacterium]